MPDFKNLANFNSSAVQDDETKPDVSTLQDGLNQLNFTHLICDHLRQQDLDAALTNAQIEYLNATNSPYSPLLVWACTLGIPYSLRKLRLDEYMTYYGSVKTDNPQHNLLCLLQGPPPSQSYAQGGAGIHSFKWFILQNLSTTVKADGLIPIYSIYKPGSSERVINEKHAVAMVGQAIAHLSEIISSNTSKSKQFNNKSSV